MTNPPYITEAAIRAKVTESSYARGVDYYHSGTRRERNLARQPTVRRRAGQ